MQIYDNKILQTKKTPGVTIIILDDVLKRGGDKVVPEYTRSGNTDKEDLLKIIRGEKQ